MSRSWRTKVNYVFDAYDRKEEDLRRALAESRSTPSVTKWQTVTYGALLRETIVHKLELNKQLGGPPPQRSIDDYLQTPSYHRPTKPST